MIPIHEPDPKVKKVDDLDITLAGGIVVPITIDFEAGDTVDWDTHADAIVIALASKTASNGETKLPAEEITIFKKNILIIQHRTREVSELTLAQKEEWRKTLQELRPTILQ